MENSLSTYEPHSCVVVYSVVQRSSFRQAEEIINYLWRENVTRDKAVILVGNKADLARSRVIPTSGECIIQKIEIYDDLYELYGTPHFHSQLSMVKMKSDFFYDLLL